VFLEEDGEEAGMTKERLRFVIEQCYLRQRLAGHPARYVDTARFLGVTPITLRRWLRGERPVPRQVEIILEIFHEWPEVQADRLAEIMRNPVEKS
jgi:hypothetical protein